MRWFHRKGPWMRPDHEAVAWRLVTITPEGELRYYPRRTKDACLQAAPAARERGELVAVLQHTYNGFTFLDRYDFWTEDGVPYGRSRMDLPSRTPRLLLSLDWQGPKGEWWDLYEQLADRRAVSPLDELIAQEECEREAV